MHVCNITWQGASGKYILMLTDESYRSAAKTGTLRPDARERIVPDLQKQFGWFNFSVVVQGDTHFRQRFAGPVETMQVSKN